MMKRNGILIPVLSILAFLILARSPIQAQIKSNTDPRINASPIYVVPETRQQVYETRTVVQPGPSYYGTNNYANYYSSFYSNYHTNYQDRYYNPYSPPRPPVETVRRDTYIDPIPVHQRVPEPVAESQKAGSVSIYETVKPNVNPNPAQQYYGESRLIYDSAYDRTTYDSRDKDFHTIHTPKKGFSYLDRYNTKKTTHQQGSAAPGAANASQGSSAPASRGPATWPNYNNTSTTQPDGQSQPVTQRRHLPKNQRDR